MIVTTEFDYSIIKRIEDAEKKYGKKCIERALRDATKTAKTTLRNEVNQRYNMKTKKEFNDYVRTKPGVIITESHSLTPGTDTHFSITPKAYKSQKGIKVGKRKKATVTIKSGNKKKMAHAFVMNPQAIKYGHTLLFEHGSSKRSGKDIIKSVKSVSAAQMASNKEVSDKTMEVMEETLSKRLDYWVDREAKKIANN